MASDLPVFDCVHACDLRYRGGTSSALRGELAAAVAAGQRIALLPLLGPEAPYTLTADPRLEALCEALGVPILAPETEARCEILFCHHPQVFRHMPDRALALRPDRVVLVLHQPPLDGAGRQQYDPGAVLAVLDRLFLQQAWLAPVGPLVRAQLALLDQPEQTLLPEDLPNLLDLRDWPLRDRPPPGRDGPVVIGRHARADRLKWPEDPEVIRAVWPDRADVEVRILGGVHLPEGMALPANWRVLPFRETGLARFLHGLDFYVYHHHPDWVEAFGMAPAEAMATGLVCLLPPALRPSFGPGALYAAPQDVLTLIERLRADPEAYLAQSRAARAWIEAHHGLARFADRQAALRKALRLPDRLATGQALPVAAPPLPLQSPWHFVRPPARQRLLLVCGNGIGLGHVTRLMAIARRLPDWIEPIFLTRSLGTHLLRQQGFSADYIESSTRSGVTVESWNEAFAVETENALAATGARMVVFDSNDVYPGLLQLMPMRPDVHWFWLRRALWQPHHRLDPRYAPAFRLVIEPAELAGAEDGGPTMGAPDVARVGPVLVCNPDQRLARDAAAVALGVDPGRRVAAVQLGSGRNYDMEPVRRAVLAALAQQEVQVIEIANPLAPARAPMPGDPASRAVFPLYPLSRALDLMVVAPGYNSFHECAYGGVPAIYVPNRHGIMDDQHLRAAWAQSAGLGLCLTREDAPRAEAAVRRALAPDFARGVALRAGRLGYVDGAAQLSRLIELALVSARTDGKLSRRLPRG
ncbi:glycosyltransferase [Neotabrizicola sp. sgz301269]|uniref:glycosyltransferase n=1 Tax=Neotabrizicola sp. sgz301269 TaxID=3276282 RepID=UPI00376F9BA1